MGGIGDDQLYGDGGNDALNGGIGNDYLEGGVGNDTYKFVVGAGIDHIVDYDLTVGNVDAVTFTGVASTALTALERQGNALVLKYGAGDQVIVDDYFRLNSSDYQVEKFTFIDDGVTWDEAAIKARVITVGTAGSDIIRGYNEGTNRIYGLDGNDDLRGDALADMIDGGAGNDYLRGGEGNDTLVGDIGDDQLYGDGGNDVLNGGVGFDTLIGGVGNDTYVVDNVGDVVTELGNEGIDTVQSSITYTLGNNVENLTLIGTSVINGTGNTVDNILTGNSAANVLTGGIGNDTYVVGTGDSIAENANEGTDTVKSAIAWTLGANLENLTLTGTTAINGTGNTLNNVLTGNSAANVLTGGVGNDTYVVGTGDSIVENTGEGTDIVQSSITWTLGNNLEHLTLTGTSAINGTGNGLNNILTGNSGANVLTGGAGSDTYLVGAGDSIVENVSPGIDTVKSAITWTLGLNLENLILTGTAAINGTGNTVNNAIIGNSAANLLSGLDGNDMLTGGLGKDTLTGGLGNDVFDFNLATESQAGLNKDVITDFVSGSDKIDLAGIDAVVGGSDNAFTYINMGAFTSVAGQLRFHVPTNTLQGDTDGNGVADVEIQLTGVASVAVTDLVL